MSYFFAFDYYSFWFYLTGQFLDLFEVRPHLQKWTFWKSM